MAWARASLHDDVINSNPLARFVRDDPIADEFVYNAPRFEVTQTASDGMCVAINRAAELNSGRVVRQRKTIFKAARKAIAEKRKVFYCECTSG